MKFLVNVFVTLCFLFSSIGFSQYILSSTNAAQTGQAMPGTANNPIMRIRILVGASPITLDSLLITSNGCTNCGGDVSWRKVFYTGAVDSFSTATPYGIASIGAFSYMGVSSTLTLLPGFNYFWLAYDITSFATMCDCLSASCDSLYFTAGVHKAPTVDNTFCIPVAVCPTSLNEVTDPASELYIYPNPVFNELSFSGLRSNLLSICTLTGENITIRNGVVQNGSKKTLNVSFLAPGIYFLRSGSETRKFVKL